MNLLWSMLKMLTGAYARSDMREAEKGNSPKTWIGRLFATFAWGLEIIVETAKTVKLWDNLEHAAGAALDRYGVTFGVEREGTSDDFYRVMIMVKMIAQVSGGDTDTVIQAAAALYDLEMEQIDVEELFPAKGRVYINNEDMTPEKRVRAAIIGRLLKRIVACGVGLDVVYRLIEEITGTTYVAGISGTCIDEEAGHRAEPPSDLNSEFYFIQTTSCYIVENGGGPDNV